MVLRRWRTLHLSSLVSLLRCPIMDLVVGVAACGGAGRMVVLIAGRPFSVTVAHDVGGVGAVGGEEGGGREPPWFVLRPRVLFSFCLPLLLLLLLLLLCWFVFVD